MVGAARRHARRRLLGRMGVAMPRSWDDVIGNSDSSGNNRSFLARMGTFGQQYTDPLYWIFGRKYTDKLEGLADKSNRFLSKIARQDPVVQFDRRNNPLQDTPEGKKAGDWAENKPLDSIAAVLGGVFGGGALLGGGASGGSAAGGLGSGAAPAGMTTAGFMPGSAATGAAGLEGVTVVGSSGAAMTPGTAAAMAAATGTPAASSQGYDWKRLMNQSSPGGQQQPQQQGARPMTWQQKLRAGLGRIGDNMLQIDSEAAKSLSEDQLANLKRNALLNMGLGMMSASGQGAGFGEAAAFGLGRAQNNLTGALQRGYENARQNRQEQRQMERDKASDDRFQTQMDYQMARDQMEQERADRQFERSMNLDERALQWREQDISRDDAQFDRQMRLAEERRAGGIQQPPSGYRWNAQGNLEPIPGGPADPSNKTGNFQEAERTAAFLGSRLANSLRTLKEIPADDQTPGIMEKGAELMGSEIAANVWRSEGRQRANAAQRDALDAALTLATGAAYTKEQIDALRVSYFPQIGDSDAVKTQKAQSFEMLLEAARVKAGRAASAIDEVMGKTAPGASGGGRWKVKQIGD